MSCFDALSISPGGRIIVLGGAFSEKILASGGGGEFAEIPLKERFVEGFLIEKIDVKARFPQQSLNDGNSRLFDGARSRLGGVENDAPAVKFAIHCVWWVARKERQARGS